MSGPRRVDSGHPAKLRVTLSVSRSGLDRQHGWHGSRTVALTADAPFGVVAGRDRPGLQIQVGAARSDVGHSDRQSCLDGKSPKS